jgi:hypothetical protein
MHALYLIQPIQISTLEFSSNVIGNSFSYGEMNEAISPNAPPPRGRMSTYICSLILIMLVTS